jgi:hypothetical protein
MTLPTLREMFLSARREVGAPNSTITHEDSIPKGCYGCCQVCCQKSCLQQLIRIAFIPRSGLLKSKYTVRLRTAMKISLKLLDFFLIKGRGCELIRSISLGTPSLKQTG